ncbi:MAG: hypothetical protein U1F48_11225 [Burkholderiales bacterium]
MKVDPGLIAAVPQERAARLRGMLVRALRVLAVVAVGLLTGLAFAHLLEQPAKLHYDADLYLTLQKTLYAAWGARAGWLEPAAIAATIALAAVLHRERQTFALTLGALGALLLAFPVVFLLFVAPANEAFRAATTVPAHWELLRSRWEAGQVLRFVLQFAALCLLVISVVRDTPRERSGGPAA